MRIGSKRRLVVFSIVAGSVRPVLAGGGGDIGGQEMTYQHCTEQVVKTGTFDVTKFNAEVQKCIANPVNYPPPPSLATSTPEGRRWPSLGAGHLSAGACSGNAHRRQLRLLLGPEDQLGELLRSDSAA